MRNIVKLILSLGEVSKDYMVLVDKNLRVAWVNKQLQKKGFKKVKGKLCKDVFKGKEEYCDYIQVKKALETKQIINYNKKNVETSIIPVTVDNVSFALVVSKNILYGEDFFETIINNTLDVITIIDTKGKILFETPSLERVTGYKVKDMVGKNVLFFLHPGDVLKARTLILDALRKPRQTKQFKMRVRHKKGHYLWLEAVGKPLLEQGKIKGFIINSRDITNEKKVRDELIKLKIGVEKSPVIIFSTDKEGVINHVNPAFEKIYGYSKKYAIGKTPRILKSGKHDKEFYKRLWKTILAKKTFSTEFINRTKSSKLINIKATISPIIEESKISGFLAIQQDITAEKEYLSELQESEYKFKSFFETAIDGILVADAQSKKFIYANPSICKMLGYSKKELLKLSVYDIHPKENLKEVLSNFEKQVKREIKLTPATPVKRKDGEIIYCDINSNPITLSNKYLVGFFRDVTEEKKAKDLLEKEKEFSDKLLDTAPGFILVLDLKGRIKLFNRAAENISGYKKAEVIGRNWFDLFITKYEKRSVLNVFNKLKSNAGDSVFENYIITKKGQKRLISWRNSVIKDESNKIYAIIAVGIDITKQKKAELEKERLTTELQQRVSELERFQTLTVGRELRMVELKNKVKELEMLLQKKGVKK